MIRVFIASSLLTLVAFIFPAILVYLFPYTGLGRIIALPFIIIFSLGVVIGYFYLTKKEEKVKNYPLLSTIVALICIVLINLVLFPQENRPSILTQLNNYINVYQNYDEIIFEDIYIPQNDSRFIHNKDSLQRYVAALHKFQTEIPYDSAYSIYFAEDRFFVNGKEVNPILTSKNDIPIKLKTGAEKVFYDILNFRY